MDDENSLITERRAKLARLRAAGVAFPNDYRRDALAGDLHAAFDTRDDDWLLANPTAVKVGGRMMFKRGDGQGELREARGPHRPDPAVPAGRTPRRRSTMSSRRWDVGDIVGAEGMLFRTKTGRTVGARRRRCGCSPSRCGRCRTSGTASPTWRCATGSATST